VNELDSGRDLLVGTLCNGILVCHCNIGIVGESKFNNQKPGIAVNETSVIQHGKKEKGEVVPLPN
jgi:hypothetical protein